MNGTGFFRGMEHKNWIGEQQRRGSNPSFCVFTL